MNISVIIPALNEEVYIAQAVTRARAAGPYEVIVVDGGSKDNTQLLARQQGARVLESPPGRAVQQNCGALQATGDALLFLHADNWLEANALSQMRAALADDRVLGGAFRQRIEAPGFAYRLLEQGNALRAHWCRLPYGDQGIFLRRDIFETLGGFPEVQLMEDLLLMRKFRELSKPVLLAGPLYVSARRWQRHGVIRQTLRNWALLAAQRAGVPLERLARYYRVEG